MLRVVDGHLRTKVTDTILDKYTCILIINFIYNSIFKIMVGILIIILYLYNYSKIYNMEKRYHYDWFVLTIKLLLLMTFSCLKPNNLHVL